ncbi:UPF0223 family protein [Tuanshanicoccus lijuaniae]|uniref:UPF0223 family protein n=1 Tax=Aerococcaceae bacterium zg-1292 TaxID=2774330 RepID=UPI001BD81B39|nr:UPF0223 family protein [Aerococcaceae bacterium zg-A91]MBS4458846.1 UPF0223 family protein [Aerococcaceae bacterium zg-BR33]
MQNYPYPIDMDWSMDETIKVVDFFAAVEEVYETGIDASAFEAKYKTFKSVVTSISEEKQLDKAFASQSGYSIYQAVKAFKAFDKKTGKKLKISQ